MSDNPKEHNSHIRRMDEALNEPVLDHDYDGIEELDNNLPSWWINSFYLSIIVGVVYFAYHNILYPADVHEQHYIAEIKAYEQAESDKAALLASQKKELTPEEMLAIMKDPSTIRAGEALYTERCLACHAAGGAGQIGPNLTDAYWLNGDGSAAAIEQIINKGVTEKGMPAWEAVFSDDEQRQITAYVYALRDTKPPNGKAPQGEKKES